MEIRTGVLRRDIELIRPGVHGNYWMIFDPVSESYFRISSRAYTILSRMSKDCPVAEFVAGLRKFGIDSDEAEVEELIRFLASNNLLAPELGHYDRKLDQLRQIKKDTLWLRIVSSYLFFRLPAWHPQKFLDRIAPYVRFMGERWFVWLLLLPALGGYLLAFRDTGAIRTMFLDSLSWAGLVKYFFAIIALKIFHEASHAIAAIRFGCRVRAVGISVIFLYPRFFSDTTDSWRLPRRQRLLIDAGGLLGELMLGGLAALLWCFLPPGVMRSTMFYIFAVSTISTLLVNGNPLIRFDGYYILCDLLNIENLMGRSTEYIKHWWRFLFFRIGEKPEETHPFTLAVFGISAFIYRILLYTSIILIIYHSFVKSVAVVMLVLEVYTIFILPMYRELQAVKRLSGRAGKRADLTFAGIVAVVGCFILFLPLSWGENLPGEIRAERNFLVTVREGGFLAAAPPREPRPFRQGEVIVRLQSHTFDFNMERLRNRMEESALLIRQQQVARDTLGDSLLTLQKFSSEKSALTELESRKALQCLRAPASGIFVPNLLRHSPGAFLPSGAVLGMVKSSSRRILAYADDRQLKKLRPDQTVELRMPDLLKKYSGRILAVNPVPSMLEPSALLQPFGGPIPVYVSEEKSGEFISAQPLYRVEIEPEKDFPFQVGRSVTVKVTKRERLATELGRWMMFAFRKEF